MNLCLDVWVCLKQGSENMMLVVLLQIGAKVLTVEGSWPKAAVILSLNPLLPYRPADQPRRWTVGSAQHIVSEAVQL